MGLGITAKVEYQQGSTWVEVPNTKTATWPDIEFGEYERTHLASPDRAREYGVGLIEPQPLTFECEYKSSTLAALEEIKGEIIRWRVTGQEEEGDSYEQDGFLKKTPATFTADGETMLACEVRTTGLPVFTEGGA